MALMDGTWITAMRTGAVATHSILLLAKQNFQTIGIMGLGNTARATMLILLSQIKNRFLNVKLLKHKRQEIDFINRFSCFENVSFTIVDSIQELVQNSDVVFSGVTYLDHDVCNDDCFDEGVLVVPTHTKDLLIVIHSSTKSLQMILTMLRVLKTLVSLGVLQKYTMLLQGSYREEKATRKGLSLII